MSNDVQLQQAIATAKAKIAEIKATAKAKRQLAALSNDKLLTAKATMELKQEDISHVKGLIEQCKGVIEQIEVYDTTSKQVKKWGNSANFQFDILTQLVSNLFGNVQYSNPAHKEIMLGIVNVPEVLILEFNQAMSGNTRYSSLQDQMLHGSAGNEEQLRNIVAIVGEYLGVEFNLDQFTQARLDQIEQRAVARAEKDQAQHEEAKLLHDQALSL